MRKQFKTFFFESENLVKVDFDEKLHPYCKNQTPAAIMRWRENWSHRVYSHGISSGKECLFAVVSKH